MQVPFLVVLLLATLQGALSNSRITEFECPSDGFHAIPGECSENYYACISGNYYIQSCPENTFFDPITLQCTPSDQVSCRDQLASTSTSTPITTTTMESISTGFPCPGDGNFPIPGECSSNYFICVDGNSFPATCPGNTIFDPLVLQCVVPDDASCSVQSSTTMSPFICVGDGVFAIPNQCTADYYICVGGVAYPATCPGDSIFDPELNLCVPSEVASCLTTTAPSITTAGPFTCPADEGSFAIPGSCGPDYIICIGGTPFAVMCPGNGIFDPLVLLCVLPEEASCQPLTTGGPTQTTGAPESTTEALSTIHPTQPTFPPTTPEMTTESTNSTNEPFVCPSPDGFFANPYDCESYYVCSNDRPILQFCPPSLVFNPALGQCDYPLNVPECAPFRCPEPDGKFPNPEDCSTFWTCVDSRPVLQDCPPGLVFNPDKETCDFLSNVPSCQNTQSP